MLPRQAAATELVGHEVAEPVLDPRVAAVLEVLAGQAVHVVAQERALDAELIQRWVRDFFEAGEAAVTNTPLPQVAQQRDRFLATFAHELRTPLAVAEGWAALLADGDVPPTMAQDAAAKLVDALGRLGGTVQDVELLAAASMGRLRVERTTVTVGELVRRAVGTRRVDGLGPQTVVWVDSALFALIIRDMWRAARSEPTPWRVRVVVHEVGDAVQVDVVRDGAPIDPRTLQALFDPFDDNDDASGVTIGLYLARALTVAHAGTMGVNQDEESAQFWVKIPRLPQTAAPRKQTQTPPEE